MFWLHHDTSTLTPAHSAQVGYPHDPDKMSLTNGVSRNSILNLTVAYIHIAEGDFIKLPIGFNVG